MKLVTKCYNVHAVALYLLLKCKHLDVIGYETCLLVIQYTQRLWTSF